ncbi:MAG TPA: hypothetical protein VGJ70_19505 [Solirubrobacteraceae bacterium]
MMRFVVVLGALVLASAPVARADNGDCQEARCAVQNEINRRCHCDESSNHGRYVSCVAHVVNDLAKDGTIPNNCRGRVKRCAARSTCGKPGFVTCTVPTDTCTNIDATTLVGTCTRDPAISCTQDLDCGTRCSTKHDATLCDAAGGTVGAGSCCAACVTSPTTTVP